MERNARIKIGAQLSAQVEEWPTLRDAARRLDGLPYEYLFLSDHLVGISGRETTSVFEGYTALAALAAVTEHPKLGLLVGANTFRNPAYAAKMAATIDNISGGRAIFGLGAGWHEREHEAYGFDFGASPGARLRWMQEALSFVKPLLAGETVTHSGPAYAVNSLELTPRPTQPRIPVMIGGVGERRTLRAVAEFADIWNAQVSLAGAPHKIDVLKGHCAAVGRDIADIELSIDCRVFIRDTADAARADLEAAHRAEGVQPPAPDSEYHWVGTPDQVAGRVVDFYRLGFTTVVSGFSQPYDEESMRRFASEVIPTALELLNQ
jgi:alkanesulfonate monooxygenase SsuD/methylene tetrahydromethanopterin reductase-like flavin-dependent oxidoreductase (luciferase family)